MFVKQWEERKNNYKLNFFSMYFVRNNKEIHFSFKNREKQRTQALRAVVFKEHIYVPVSGHKRYVIETRKLNKN